MPDLVLAEVMGCTVSVTWDGTDGGAATAVTLDNTNGLATVQADATWKNRDVSATVLPGQVLNQSIPLPARPAVVNDNSDGEDCWTIIFDQQSFKLEATL